MLRGDWMSMVQDRERSWIWTEEADPFGLGMQEFQQSRRWNGLLQRGPHSR